MKILDFKFIVVFGYESKELINLKISHDCLIAPQSLLLASLLSMIKKNQQHLQIKLPSNVQLYHLTQLHLSSQKLNNEINNQLNRKMNLRSINSLLSIALVLQGKSCFSQHTYRDFARIYSFQYKHENSSLYSITVLL